MLGDPLYLTLFLVIFLASGLGLVLLHRMRRASQRLQCQLESAEVEMRSMNLEYNTHSHPKWEFALTQHGLGIALSSIGLNFSTREILVAGLLKRNKVRCPPPVTGDIIGCFFNPFKHRLYFTFNGQPQPSVVFKPTLYRLFPTIHANGACAFKSNFGHAPFSYSWANTYHYGLASSHPEDSSPPEYHPSRSSLLPDYSQVLASPLFSSPFNANPNYDSPSSSVESSVNPAAVPQIT